MICQQESNLLFRPVGFWDGANRHWPFRRFYLVLPLADAKRLCAGKKRQPGDGKKLLHAAGLLVGGLCVKKSLQGL